VLDKVYIREETAKYESKGFVMKEFILRVAHFSHFDLKFEIR